MPDSSETIGAAPIVSLLSGILVGVAAYVAALRLTDAASFAIARHRVARVLGWRQVA